MTEVSSQGHNNSNYVRPRNWRWILGAAAIFVGWQFTGLILTVGAANFFNLDVELLFSTDEKDMALVRTQPAWSTGATLLVSFIPLFAFTILAYRFILQRPVRQLFTASGRYSWRATWAGFAAMSVILIGFSASDILLNPDSYTFNWNQTAFFSYLFIAFTFLPIQTTAEELFFRGWLQQWLDNGRRKNWVVSLIGAFLFAAPHMANPEVSGSDLLLPLISYGATGFMLAWVTFRDKTLEIAIGAHFANNLLTATFVSTQDSALPSVSLFTTPDVSWGPAAVVSVVIVPIFIWLSGKWRAKVLA
jgi:membrane protease YdiL (CAAX protease family)